MANAAGQLRSVLRRRLLDQMIRTVGNPTDKWKVLVVDRAALRILAAALHVNQLVDEGITIVEMLDMRREPLPRIPAIYFITPSPETIQQLAQESTTQYRTFHLFFTGRLPDYQMNVLRQNPGLLRKVKSLVELDVQLLALESRLFSLDRPAASLPQLHAERTKEAREEMAVVSDRLTEACKMVAPTVDWCVRSDATSTVSRTVASLVKEQLHTARIERASQRESKGDDRDVTPQGSSHDDESPTKGTLLIVDRVSDLISPLLHEFSYQSMAHDLLTLDYRKPGGAHIEIPDENDETKTKSLQLDDEEKDPVWSEIRSSFIQEALTKAQDALKVFLETDAAFKIRGRGAGDVDIKDMGAAVRALPESQMRADKHAMHIRAARECLDKCQSLNLTNLALVEQDLVVGRDPDGSKIRSESMVESIVNILADTSIPVAHRMRLIMTALVISEGLPGLGGEHSALAMSMTLGPKLRRSRFEAMPEADAVLSSAKAGLKQLLNTAKANADNFHSNLKPRTESEESVAARLKHKYAAKHAQKQSEKVNAARHRRHGLEEEDGQQYHVARYHPPLRSVMMDLVDDELDTDAFPTTGTVSVDSIIASMGQSSLDAQNRGEGARDGERKAKFTASSIRNHSAAVAGMVKSMARGDSYKSSGSTEDDGRFRLAERDHVFVVFVVGGVCYSEVRALYEVCAKREANVLLGGCKVLTPHSFVEALAAVADPVVRIRVMLPPLPIELAQTRAARARAMEAGSARSRKSTKGGNSSGVSASGNSYDTAEHDVEMDSAEGGDGDVEVVVGYKKSRGMRLFGRKK